MILQYAYWYEVVLLFWLMQLIRLTVGSLILLLLMQVVKKNKTSRHKLLLILILQYAITFIVASIMVITTDIIKSDNIIYISMLYVCIMEIVTIPLSLFIYKK